jgi:hypothetical protein
LLITTLRVWSPGVELVLVVVVGERRGVVGAPFPVDAHADGVHVGHVEAVRVVVAGVEVVGLEGEIAKGHRNAQAAVAHVVVGGGSSLMT